MASLDPKVARTVVLEAKPLAFNLGEANFAGSHSLPRVWWDSLKILGQDMGKYLFAVDGGQSINDVTAPTAACNLIEFSLAGPQMKASLEMRIGVPVSPALKTNLEALVSSVKKSEAKDYTIQFGKANQSQEYKNDDKWGLIADLSNIVLVPVENTAFNLDFNKYGFLGGSTTAADYMIITISGVMLDRKSFNKPAIDIVHANSTEKGQYPILSIDQAAATAA